MTEMGGGIQVSGTDRPASPPPQPPPRPSRTSLRPAAIVVVLAAVIILVFAIGAAVVSHPKGQTPSPRGVVGTAEVGGHPIRAVPAAALLKPIVTPGEPPSDIRNALTVPQGTQRVGYQRNPESTSQYDRTVNLRWAGTQGGLVGFYRSELRRMGWRIQSVSPTNHQGIQILAVKGGSDGWYWQAGLKVAATTFPAAKGGSATTAGESTRFDLELLQLADNF